MLNIISVLKNPFHLICIVVIWNFQLTAQPTIEWENNFGGSNDDRPFAIKQTFDGKFIVAGWTFSNDGDVGSNYGAIDGWVVKFDNTGNIIWGQNYGGSGEDRIWDIEPTIDHGYIVCGKSNSSDGDVGENFGDFDFWVFKIDSLGNIEWSRVYGGSGEDNAWDIEPTSDNGYILAGQSNSDDGIVGNNYGDFDYWVIKLDIFGNIEWTRNYGGSKWDSARSIKEIDGKGYIVAGYSFSDDWDVNSNNGFLDYWIIRLDYSGNIVWEKNYGGSNADVANFILPVENGSFIIEGYSQSNDGDVDGNLGGKDFWLVKIDSLGEIIWKNNFGGSSDDEPQSMIHAVDGNVIVAGGTFSIDGNVSQNHGNADYWLLKLDSFGNILWEKNYGGSDWDVALDLIETENEDLIVVGLSQSLDGDVGGNYGNGISPDYWIVKLAPIMEINRIEELTIPISVYPNPSNGSFSISADTTLGNFNLEVYDLLGRLIYSSQNADLDKPFNILSKGIHLLKISQNNLFTSKIIIVN